MCQFDTRRMARLCIREVIEIGLLRSMKDSWRKYLYIKVKLAVLDMIQRLRARKNDYVDLFNQIL